LKKVPKPQKLWIDMRQYGEKLTQVFIKQTPRLFYIIAVGLCFFKKLVLALCSEKLRAKAFGVFEVNPKD